MYDATTISQKIPSNLVQKYQEGLTAATTRYSDIIIRKEQRG